MNGELRRAVVHEAGHAVIARALRRDVLSCWVGQAADGSVGGGTRAFAHSPLFHCAGVAAELVIFESIGNGSHKDVREHLETFLRSTTELDPEELASQWQGAFSDDLRKTIECLAGNKEVLTRFGEALPKAPVQEVDDTGGEIHCLAENEIRELLKDVTPITDTRSNEPGGGGR